MSKARKSIKLATKVFHASGTAMSAINCPATSSITTNCGSLLPDAREMRVAAGIPIAVANAASPSATGAHRFGCRPRDKAAHSSTLVADAQVPGPGLKRPTPKKVATAVAQSGAAGRDKAAEAGADEEWAEAGATLAPWPDSEASLNACPLARFPECLLLRLLREMRSHTRRSPTSLNR